jgi:hypothetical protein
MRTRRRNPSSPRPARRSRRSIRSGRRHRSRAPRRSRPATTSTRTCRTAWTGCPACANCSNEGAWPNANSVGSGRRPRTPRRAEQRFRGALAEVTNALDAGELDRAAPALERARSLRPKAAELGPLSTRLAEAVTRRDAATLAAQARELESKERWADALAKHEAALALNPHLATSLSARARCSTRAALQERIEGHLSRSDRLSAAAVLDEARALLAEARTVEPAGPEHRALTERLAKVIAGAAQPIAVTLVSDGVTEVTVHRVGRLGSFERRTLELVPGTYTVTGRRPGYRDVRQQLVVKAETLPPQLPVRCDERI